MSRSWCSTLRQTERLSDRQLQHNFDFDVERVDREVAECSGSLAVAESGCIECMAVTPAEVIVILKL
jgi:hypothetical protein